MSSGDEFRLHPPLLVSQILKMSIFIVRHYWFQLQLLQVANHIVDFSAKWQTEANLLLLFAVVG